MNLKYGVGNKLVGMGGFRWLVFRGSGKVTKFRWVVRKLKLDCLEDAIDRVCECCVEEVAIVRRN